MLWAMSETISQRSEDKQPSGGASVKPCWWGFGVSIYCGSAVTNALKQTLLFIRPGLEACFRFREEPRRSYIPVVPLILTWELLTLDFSGYILIFDPASSSLKGQRSSSASKQRSQSCRWCFCLTPGHRRLTEVKKLSAWTPAGTARLQGSQSKLAGKIYALF